MRLVRGVAWSAVFAMALGCGPKADGTQGMDSEGVGSGATSGSGLSDGDESETGGSGDAACEAFWDEPPGNSVAIEVRNTRAEPIFLPVPCGVDWLTIENEAGHAWPPPFCADSCETMMGGGCSTCGGCAVAAYVRVEPGAQYVVDWPGLVFEVVDTPETCVEQLCAETCPIHRTATGILEGTAVAATLADCEAIAASAEECECDPDPSGVPCTVYPAEEATATLSVTVAIDADASGAAEFLFE